jgi:hypothetical protein
VTLTLRRQPLNFPHDDPDLRWSVYCEDVCIGVIVQHRGRSDEPISWQGTMHLHAGRFGNGVADRWFGGNAREGYGRVPCRMGDGPRAIGDEGWALHLKHAAWSEAQSDRWRRQREGTEPGGYG